MNKILGIILAVILSGCGSDSKNSGRAPNVFKPTELVTQNADSYLYASIGCNAADKKMDPRLARGQTFTTVSSTRDYQENSKLWTQRNVLKIDSVDLNASRFLFTETIKTSDGFAGWIKGKTDVVITNTSTYATTDVMEFSPSLQKAIANDNYTPDNGLDVNWWCRVESSGLETGKVEKGTYTLSSGREVNAIRAEKVVSGSIVCTKLSKTSATDPNPPMPVEEKQLGQGTLTEVYMTSPDVPNQRGCMGETEIDRLREIKDSHNRILDSSGERLENAVF